MNPYDRRAMVGRNPARYLAPIMLVATIAGVYLIVHHSATVHSGPSHQHQHRPRGPKFYIVKPGDNLTSISIKTSVPLATIQQLNPSVDPNTLRAGRRLKLRR
jgi:LysM repeat protein